MAFFCITHMALLVNFLSVEDFNHARLDFLSMCNLAMFTKYWPCTFFFKMVLIFLCCSPIAVLYT